MGLTYGLKAFKKTISVLNTAEQLTTVTTEPTGRFAQSGIILAPSGNSAIVYIGGSTVNSTDGFPLAAGSSISIGDLVQQLGKGGQLDLSAVYVYGAATNVVNVLHDIKL
jgi:hypothetical protein